ncbi:unnamed protein product (macronuclear) [Paramecium tetraurelia]|uniref:Uncharacterized protein n=1 Tax=Paramecium tetraurelia TaxID=5888 RepID=A0C1E1_PARTE|nr:uncharacterized protein GSPATT00034084001 [Paramecium tetraurelia]CAK64608.1 unnamed protein product [Paramecium tetraurelia]|eukprot:XP_001432006.1 hypothetical protein (macronuclear) [Paramecium tetraurelia strain d4-2]
MKTISIIAIIVVLQLGQVSSLSFNDPECSSKYLNKFGTANNADGSGASKIAFTGDVAFVSGTANVKVNLRYSDVELYNDTTYFARFVLILKYGNITSNSYADPVQVTDLTITPSNNFQKQWRYYTFTIPGTELKTRLVETSNSNQFIYKGYYALAYYAAGTDQLQYTFFFEFSVTIEKGTGAALDTSFKPLSYQSTLGCTTSSGCNVKPDTTLKWCTDLTCTAFGTPDLHLNDQFVLQQVIKTSGMSGYYLTGTEVWYTGSGLNKKASQITLNNSTPGQVIIQLKAEIAWRAVTIKVTSTLSTSQAGGRRMLVQTEFDPVSGETEQIECIKDEGSEKCADCTQECDANGFAHDGCPSCSVFPIISICFLGLIVSFHNLIHSFISY